MGRPRKKQVDWHLKALPELLEMLKGYRDTVRSWEQSNKTPETVRILERGLGEQSRVEVTGKHPISATIPG